MLKKGRGGENKKTPVEVGRRPSRVRLCARSSQGVGIPFLSDGMPVGSVQRYDFSTNKQTFQKVFHSEHGVLFVEYLKNAIFKPSERISAPKYGINPQRSRKAKFDPFLNVCAVINGIGRFGSWYVSLQGNPYCRYQSHSGQHGIPMSNSFRGEQCSASPVSTLVCYMLWSPDMMTTVRICVAIHTDASQGDGVPRGQNTRRKAT